MYTKLELHRDQDSNGSIMEKAQYLSKRDSWNTSEDEATETSLHASVQGKSCSAGGRSLKIHSVQKHECKKFIDIQQTKGEKRQKLTVARSAVAIVMLAAPVCVLVVSVMFSTISTILFPSVIQKPWRCQELARLGMYVLYCRTPTPSLTVGSVLPPMTFGFSNEQTISRVT